MVLRKYCLNKEILFNKIVFYEKFSEHVISQKFREQAISQNFRWSLISRFFFNREIGKI